MKEIASLIPVSCSQQIIEEAAKLPPRQRIEFVAAALMAREIMAMQTHDTIVTDGTLRAPAMYLWPLETAATWAWLRACAKKYLAYARHNRVTVEIWPSEAGCPLPPKE